MTNNIEHKIDQYIQLLLRWNRAYNLTAITDLDQIKTHHIADSLSVEPFLDEPQVQHVLDVGTGAGLPGIPLAISLPKLLFTLLDSNSKKTRFLTQVVAELGLTNVQVVHSRVENYQTSQRFDVIISRAVCSVDEFIRQTHHLLKPDGRFLAMKGRYPTEELAELTQAAEVLKLDVPGLSAERHLVIVQGVTR